MKKGQVTVGIMYNTGGHLEGTLSELWFEG